MKKRLIKIIIKIIIYFLATIGLFMLPIIIATIWGIYL